jgi:hypothetical protein
VGSPVGFAGGRRIFLGEEEGEEEEDEEEEIFLEC